MDIHKNYIRIGIRIKPRIRTRIELSVRIGIIGIRRVYLYTYIYEQRSYIGIKIKIVSLRSLLLKRGMDIRKRIRKETDLQLMCT